MVGQPKNSINASSSDQVKAPTECKTRGRAEDAAEAVKDMTALMKEMDPALVQQMVNCRNNAINLTKAFPEGDRRFDDFESDEDDNVDKEVEEDMEENDDNMDSDKEPDSDAIDEPCKGLLDDEMDVGPRACLDRVRKQYGFDVVAEMEAASLDFLQRIRLINFVRSLAKDGKAAEVIEQVRQVMAERNANVLAADEFLTPVIEGDLLLTVLETEDEEIDESDDHNRESDEVKDAIEKSLRDADVL